MAWDLNVLKTPAVLNKIWSDQCKSCLPSSCWDDKEVHSLHITRAQKEAYPPPAVGKAGFCKLQKLICFIMEMITLFRSGWWQWLCHHPDRHTTWVNWQLGNHQSPNLCFQKKHHSEERKTKLSMEALRYKQLQGLCFNSFTLPHLRKIFMTFKLPKTELRLR